ncbi:MAG: hypothetical protein ABIT92_02320 [Gammaproteobacteria bacterium]
MNEPIGSIDRPQTNRLIESKLFSEISPAFIEFRKAGIDQSISARSPTSYLGGAVAIDFGSPGKSPLPI